MYTANQNFLEIYDYIYDYMKICNSKIMLVVNNNDYIVNLFELFIKSEYNINYRHNSKSKKISKHLIITNYNL